MTGPELKQLREDLGAAIGRRLSVADMAKLCGLAPANGADTIRKWEEGDGPSGPVAALLSILRIASQKHQFENEAFDQVVASVKSPITHDIILRAAMICEVRRRLS